MPSVSETMRCDAMQHLVVLVDAIECEGVSQAECRLDHFSVLKEICLGQTVAER